jgi:hypothetical protein
MKNFSMYIMGLLIILAACKKDAGGDSTQGISGCTDKNSINYNPLATVNDGSCKYPSTQQRALLIEYTATTCHYCGEWGHDTFESLISSYPDKVVPICIHKFLNTAGDDPMEPNSALLNSFISVWSSGAPKIWINNLGSLGYGQFSPAMAAQTATPAHIGLLSNFTIVGDTVVIKTFTKFFDNPAGGNWFGEFYINAYVLESGIPGANNGSYNQSTDHPRPDYKHDFTLRTAANPANVFGILLFAGTAQNPILQNSNILKTIKVKLDPSWNHSNIRVSLAIWLKVGPKTYQYINGYLI